jgi:predicted Zn-dependent peptidase
VTGRCETRCYTRPVTVQHDDLLDIALPNGLRIVIEPMPWLPTLSLALHLPVGSVNDPADAFGSAAVLTEWLQRGAGALDCRAHGDALDALGVRRGASVGRETLSLAAAFLERDAEAVLPLLADIVLRPRLEEADFAAVRQLALHDLAGIDDSPSLRLNEALVEAYFASPHGRSPYGVREHLVALTPEAVRSDAAQRIGPAGAVLALAGGGDPVRLQRLLGDVFGAWQGGGAVLPAPVVRPPHRRHVASEGAQVQIGLCAPAVARGEAGWYEQQVAMSVLDGNMGARLFTEVREKRGLAYSVSASTRLVRGHAFTVMRAGTTPERAGETLTVLRDELVRLAEGVAADEYERALRLLRSSLVMQSEASGARAARLASDVIHLARPRSLEEVDAALASLDRDRVNAFLAERPEPAFTIVTLGPSALGPSALDPSAVAAAERAA